MPRFDKKTWNDAVFQKYLRKIPNLKENSMIKNGVLKVNDKLKSKLIDGVGGNTLKEPIKGAVDGSFVNYDGRTNITTSSRDTFMQTKIVAGRAKGWEEKDFSTDISGEDYMPVASEVAEYWQGVDMGDILAILEGIFSMSDQVGQGFVEKHTYEKAGAIDGTSINNATQKAFGDKKKNVSMAFMHSMVATTLENLQLLEFLKYTDANGITSNIGIAQQGNKTIIIDDDMPAENVDATYKASTDTTVDSTKTYYTRTGSSSAGYVYTEVAAPTGNPSTSNYYEKTADAYTRYTTYLLGKGAIEFCNVGAKVPSEVARDAETDGGVDKLYTRQRKLYAPEYISWIGASNIISPMPNDFANGANWEIVNNGETGANKKYVDPKLIPFGRLITRG